MKHCIYCGIYIDNAKCNPICSKTNSTAGHKFGDYNYYQIGFGGRCLNNSEITKEEREKFYKKVLN